MTCGVAAGGTGDRRDGGDTVCGAIAEGGWRDADCECERAVLGCFGGARDSVRAAGRSTCMLQTDATGTVSTTVTGGAAGPVVLNASRGEWKRGRAGDA